MDVRSEARTGHSLWVAALVLGLIIAAAWIAPRWDDLTVPLQVLLSVMGFGLMVGHARKAGTTAADWGIRVDNLLFATLVFAVATAALCAPAVIFRDIELLAPFPPSELPSYFLWALFQQFVAVGGFWLPFRRAAGLPSPYASLARELPLGAAAALVFAVAHAPNVGLMVLVGVAEILWLSLFARWRNLFSLALAHAAAALVVAHHLTPSPWLPSMRVGLAYFRS